MRPGEAVAVSAACAFVASTALAQDADKACDSPVTPEIVDCLNGKAAQWDKRLNAAYQRTLKETEPKQREQLRTSQRLWMQYRDANCLYYALGEGTIARVDAADCMLRMTQERAKELGAGSEQK
ncbi:MAG TPA: lysozyme inhibitor LprI family protein [Pseudolabrys sp.]|nr:lysozyme inhibitor LprI family protein [Pseudolabrys sp.]